MLQSEYLELAIELYDIYLDNNKHPKKWLPYIELEKLKKAPGWIARFKKKKGKLSELQPVFFDYVNMQHQYRSCNTPQQWSCKFDYWLQDEYEFTKEELDELRSDRGRQSGRETSKEVTI